MSDGNTAPQSDSSNFADAILDRAEAEAAPDAAAILAEMPKAGILRQVGNFIARSGKRIVVAIAGGFVVLAGVAMLALPGPGFVVIIAGLAILATEFAWAKSALDRAKEQAQKARDKATGGDPTRAKFLNFAGIALMVVGVCFGIWRQFFR